VRDHPAVDRMQRSKATADGVCRQAAIALAAASTSSSMASVVRIRASKCALCMMHQMRHA
jgi:hypothetical protein